MAAAPADSPDPAVHTPIPPSAPPTASLPSPGLVRRIAPLVLPAPLPASLNNVPADSHGNSTPHSSTADPRTPPLRLEASLPPAPQITHGCTCPPDTPVFLRSTHTKSVAAPTPASPPACKPSAPAPVPGPPPVIPTPCACIPHPAYP